MWRKPIINMQNLLPMVTSDALKEKRLDQRLPAITNASVKIRRRGFGFNPWRYDIHLLDLSANGMAFLTPKLNLSQLQKIDFELSSGGLTTSGCAVVCNTGNSGIKQRYGLLFIETDDAFDAFLTGESLSSDEVNRLGEEIAEQYMYQRIQNDEVLFRVQNQRMVDAVTTMAGRLGQMGLAIKDDRGRVVRPVNSITVAANGVLSVPMLRAGDTAIKRVNITLITTDDVGHIRYQIDGGGVFDNIIDLLNHLCRCFDQISVP